MATALQKGKFMLDNEEYSLTINNGLIHYTVARTASMHKYGTLNRPANKVHVYTIFQ